MYITNISSSAPLTVTQTVTITASSTCAITDNQLLCATETETLTIFHTLAATIPESNTPDDAMVDQCSTSNGSQTVWMVVAIVFFVIALSAIVLNIFLGYFLHRKGKILDMSTTGTSNPNTIKVVTEGESGQLVEDDT